MQSNIGMIKMNCLKIVANGGVAFFTTLTGLLSADTLLQVNLPTSSIFIGAAIAAGIQAGLAMFKELQTQANSPTNQTKSTGKICDKKDESKLSYLVFF